ncbi:MAG: glucokinase [Alphaproteobacteria bacterium]|nr:MAG: glucokinase [Alphaproteobacteria bacterium]
MNADTPILVADIGGTNARFAIARSDNRIILEQIKILSTGDYDSLQSAALAYLRQTSGPRPAIAAIAVAGPVVGDRVKMTNCPWAFRRSSLAGELGMEQVSVLNDFEANACALPFLEGGGLLKIGSGEIQGDGTKIVIGPGTGIGVAAITPIGEGWKVLTSEGGHVGFAPADDLERQILRTVKYKYPRVSVERVISGQGFTTLHQALATLRGAEVETLSPSEITRRALENPTGHCGQVVDIFCSILGTFAGDMAVTFNATGGVYLAGGILPKIQEFFLGSRFRERFENKGRLTYVKDIPTLQIMEKHLALVGAAARIQGKFY